MALYSRGELEETNRVIREFCRNQPCFIRLNFMTDNGDRGFYANSFSKGVLGYIHLMMQNGICLGDRQLTFLSYSNSQLKSHSCWFLCRDDVNHAVHESSIENFMGDFSKEKNVLKKYARRGQCFSTSKRVCELNPDQVEFRLDDIERNGYCFTDGVGYISPELAREAAEYFKYSQVSAFQIRLAGAKGVLMVKPELEGRCIQLRKSQIKFDSRDLSFNVIRCSTFSVGFFNRSLVLLLTCLGVPDHYFLRKQRLAKQLVDANEI